MLAALLLFEGCTERANGTLSRDEAIAAAEAYLNKAAGRSDLYPKSRFRRVAYERRSTWLIVYLWDGGTGGPPTVELDKKSGEVLVAMGGQ